MSTSLRGEITRYHVGETVRLRAKATDPETFEVLPEGTAQVEWWAPGADRTGDPASVTTPMSWRTAEQDYVVYQQTDGWVPGRWTYKVTVTGTQYSNVRISTITLNL